MSWDASVFDRHAALDLVDGRLDVLVELVQTFLAHYPKLLSPLEEAVKQSDAAAVANAAHDLKGSLSFFGPTSAATAAAQLEQMAAQGDPVGMTEAHEALQENVMQLVSALIQWVATS